MPQDLLNDVLERNRHNCDIISLAAVMDDFTLTRCLPALHLLEVRRWHNYTSMTLCSQGYTPCTLSQKLLTHCRPLFMI